MPADNAATSTGLRAAQMRIARDHGLPDTCRARSSSAPIKSAQQVQGAIDFLAQPQPHIERYLLVAAAPGVDLVRERADLLFELADDERVDVFVGRAVEKVRRSRLFADRIEGGDKTARAPPPSESRRVQARARKPASPEYRPESDAGRNAGSRRSARRLPTGLPQNVRPTVSSWPLQEQRVHFAAAFLSAACT